MFIGQDDKRGSDDGPTNLICTSFRAALDGLLAGDNFKQNFGIPFPSLSISSLSAFIVQNGTRII